MKIKLIFLCLFLFLTLCLPSHNALIWSWAEEEPEEAPPEQLLVPENEVNEEDGEGEDLAPIFDHKIRLDGYTDKYTEASRDTIEAMIKDDYLNSWEMAAAVRVFRDKYQQEVFDREKIIMEKILLRRLNLTTSPFVQVEILYTLYVMNRFRYFQFVLPALILRLDHYNETVNELSYAYLDEIIKSSNNRTREARVVFNTLRKILFLSRKRLANVTKPDERLEQKLKILRWSIKVLGSQELKRLPKEVISLL